MVYIDLGASRTLTSESSNQSIVAYCLKETNFFLPCPKNGYFEDIYQCINWKFWLELNKMATESFCMLIKFYEAKRMSKTLVFKGENKFCRGQEG